MILIFTYTLATQLYLTCNKLNCPLTLANTIHHLESCISDIRKWMPLNSLKSNDSRMEFLCLYSRNTKHIAPIPQTSTSVTSPFHHHPQPGTSMSFLMTPTLCLPTYQMQSSSIAPEKDQPHLAVLDQQPKPWFILSSHPTWTTAGLSRCVSQILNYLNYSLFRMQLLVVPLLSESINILHLF